MSYIKKVKINGVGYDIGDSSRSRQQIILESDSWINNTISVSCSGVDTSNDVYISPTPTSYKKYGSCGVICVAQGINSLTFQCDTTPDIDLTINVLIFN